MGESSDGAVQVDPGQLPVCPKPLRVSVLRGGGVLGTCWPPLIRPRPLVSPVSPIQIRPNEHE